MDRMKDELEHNTEKKPVMENLIQEEIKEKKRQSYLDKIIRLFDRDLIE